MPKPPATEVLTTKGIAVPTKSQSEMEREARLNGKTLPATGPATSTPAQGQESWRAPNGTVYPAGYNPGSVATQFKPAPPQNYVTTRYESDGTEIKTLTDGTVIRKERGKTTNGYLITTTKPDGTSSTSYEAAPAATVAVGAKTGAVSTSPNKKTKSASAGTGFTSVHAHTPDPKQAADYRPHLKEISKAFDAEALRRVCTMGETEFGALYGMTEQHFEATKEHYAGFYAFKDNGSKILFVAHLDTVSPPEQRMCNYVNTAAGPMVWSRSLDDRLGAYIGLELLPKLGLTFDWLLTTNEEIGDSTALEFSHPQGKEYNWIIEFDRGGTDVVMYQFDDFETAKLVKATGASVGHGSCSDISYMSALKRKAFNWGTGYMQYHTPKSHAYLLDTFKMVGLFLDFHETNKDVVLEHTATVPKYGKWSRFGDGDRPSYDYAGSHAGAWWDDIMAGLD